MAFVEYLDWLEDVERSLSHIHDNIRMLLFSSPIPKDSRLQLNYLLSKEYQGIIESLSRLVEVTKFLEIELNFEYVDRSLQNLQNRELVFKDFDGMFGLFNDFLVREKPKFKTQISKLDTIEKHRLNEGLHCLFENCWFSSIVMSVSSIEFRMRKFMENYSNKKTLERFSLGQLIKEYLNNEEKYGNTFECHEELLNLCNNYRIFSAHPKKQIANRKKANAIMNLVFEFLLDDKMAIKS